jgi:hypothetical protein
MANNAAMQSSTFPGQEGLLKMRPFLLAFIFALGVVHDAAATGPAGSTGAEATIPGNIVRWQPGDPVPPQGVLSLIFAPRPYQTLPRQREPKVRKQ